MLWESVTDSCDVCHCTRLFDNAFEIKTTPEGTLKSRPKGRRLVGMASRRLSHLEHVSPSFNKENDVGTRSPGSELIQHKDSPVLKRSRNPLDDHDPNSQDSGYGTNFSDKDDKSRDGFQFAEPLGVAPKRLSVDFRSPNRSSPQRSSPQQNRRISSACLFRSMSSGYESMDDGFTDLLDMDTLDEDTQLPNGITNLLSGEIVLPSDKLMECDQTTTPEFSRTKLNNLRRSLSYSNERFDKFHSPNTPPYSKVRSCLFRSPNANCSTAKLHYNDSPPLKGVGKSFKRPEPPCENNPTLVKKSRKIHSFDHNVLDMVVEERIHLQRSFSFNDAAHASIDSAIHRSTTDSDLTGDFSKPCILPLESGDHDDLKSITAETLASLMYGEFKERVNKFKIVDCRYPYEYDGGHVQGAVNIYSKDLIEEMLLNPLTQVPEIQAENHKRNIIVFHCEFSWERGPNLSRFLRSIDRQRNKEHYPALHYPEMYLLHGGYQSFYKKYSHLCTPRGYLPMRHPEHEADLRLFRSKSKSWQAEKLKPSGTINRMKMNS